MALIRDPEPGAWTGCDSPCCQLKPHRGVLDETFGEALSDLLMRRGVNQYRLCQLTGLGADTVCRLIHGVRKPTEVQALRIIIGLGLDIRQGNRLLEAADFYPLSEPGEYRPSGRSGWPRREAVKQLTDGQLRRNELAGRLGA